jgi:CubicO group peptidase (beta-lactamase class C family)
MAVQCRRRDRYAPRVPRLEDEIERVAVETGFSGVVRVDRGSDVVLERAYGYAHRAYVVPNQVTTRFGIASGAKGFTALTVVSLIESGVLDRATTARSLLGADLPLIHDDVTVEHLLAHRSGIGDFIDEEAGHDITDYVLTVPVHELATTEQYVAVLGGHPSKFAPGEQFSYCNGGYVVLALLAERASGVAFHDLVAERVCGPAGLVDTEFLRSDELPGRAAVGYLSADASARTNVLHLPVRGSGDGGIYSTVADMSALWQSFFAGTIVASSWVEEMVRARSVSPPRQYGLGFWLDRDKVMLEGYDAGVSFRSVHDRREDVTHTVISNTTDGAWPLTRCLTSFHP